MYQDQDLAEQALLVRYEAYVDIGLEFCNATLGAQARRILHTSDFEQQYRRLIHLFLAENWPFVRHALEGPYLSGFVRNEIAAGLARGINWQAAHDAITSQPAAARDNAMP
jgi:hypothetical protein